MNMAIEKLTTTLKTKTWTNQQNKNYKKGHELGIIKKQIQYKNPEHMYLNF
jgi:hypothetical protein